jgi:hypothetical protein
VGSFVVEQVAQAVPDVSETLYRDRPAFERGRAEDLLHAGPHPLQDAQGRKGGRVARATVRYLRADDVGGFDLDVVYVPGRDADILGHDVTTT